MKLFRKIVDERQELEMLRVERSSFYVIFIALAIAVIVQVFAMGLDFAHVGGEFIVLLIGAAWALIGCIRCGIWGNFTEPRVKTYLLYSAAGAFVFSLSHPLRLYFRYKAGLVDCLLAFVVNFILIFVVGFLVLALLGTIIKKRREKLQRQYIVN